MAVQGPHTRTVRDARLALQAMARGDRRDWRWNDVPFEGPPPARPIKVAIVPEVPGGSTHAAQAAAVRQAGKHLQRAGYVVEEVLPPDMERGVELWHMICVTDVFAGLWPQMQKMGDPDGITSMKGWLEIHKPVDLATYIAALTEREGLLLRWMTALEPTSPILTWHQSLSAHTPQPPPQTPIAVKMVQSGDRADHQNPSRQRQKRQG